jgi:anti-sigma factor RsiW
MACSEALRTQSYFDGAVTGDEAREVERHIAGCADCTRQLRELEMLRKAIRADASYHRADASLRAKIADVLDAEPVHRSTIITPTWSGKPFWAGLASGVGATAAAAAVAFFLLIPGDAGEIADAVTGAHLRSLMGNHLLDVASNDPRVVGPWLAHHTSVAPQPVDLSAKGYVLAGAREDYLYDSGAGVTVYRHGNHVVNVFAWTPGEDVDLPQSATDNGYNIVFWRKGNVVYCAVSSIAMNDLVMFADDLKARA